MSKKSYEIDMCNGPLFGKMLVFAIPLMLSGILQLLFNAADIIVVGKFSGSTALAAVGSTSSLINLLINVFIGLSVGSNVLIARYYGAKQEIEVRETVHTAITISLLSGLFLSIAGFFLARPLLALMGTPDEVLNQAALYMKIYFLGMPIIMLYNFGSSILRATGDTKRPLYFLLIAGMINVILNLFFVIVLQMGVAGVALATVISQCFSSGFILLCLVKDTGYCHLSLRNLHINKDKLIRIAKIGIPAGLQGAIFSISNVLIQSSINSFGAVAMAGNTAASNIEGFIYTSMNAFHQTSVNFTSQNLGANKLSRINRVLGLCLVLVSITGLILGGGAYLFGHNLLGVYSSDPEVIQFGLMRMRVICLTYFTCGIMEVLVGSLRGLGYSVLPMMVSLLGACGFRILWIFTVFQWNSSLLTLYVSYPASWILTALAHALCFYFVRKKIFRTLQHV